MSEWSCFNGKAKYSRYIPLLFVEAASVSQSAEKSRVHQFLTRLYMEDLEKSPALFCEEIESIDVLACDPKVETN